MARSSAALESRGGGVGALFAYLLSKAGEGRIHLIQGAADFRLHGGDAL